MTLPLGKRILAWSAAATLITLLAIFVMVDSQFRATIREDLRENVAAGARLAAELRTSRMTDRIGRASGLALNPVLRGTVETRDAPTIRAALDDLLPQSGFDWLAVTAADGTVRAATAGAPLAEIPKATRMLRDVRYYDTGDLWRVGEDLEDVAASTVYFGDLPLGVMIGGERVDAADVDELGTYTRQTVVFLTADGIAAAPSGFASAGDLPRGVTAGADTAMVPHERTLDGERFLTVGRPLRDAEGRTVGRMVVLRSLDEALAPARRLRIALLVIAAIGLAASALLSWILARTVTVPVSRLLKATVRLGAGDLDDPIEPGAPDEIGRLARGFEQMRTSLRQAHLDLLRAERLSAVGQAASAIVHDFAQPITVVTGHVDLLPLVWEDAEEREDSLRVIRGQLTGLRGMMQEILEFTRGQDRLQRQPADIAQLLDDVARGMEPSLREKQIRLEVEHGFQGSWSIDSQRMARVLQNLVGNAAAAMKQDGTIAIRSARPNGKLRLEVADTGPGIPEAIRDTLFEPFVTHGKKGGTGLGLAIARNVIEKQGGTIRVDSSAAGTTFVLELPPGDEALN